MKDAADLDLQGLTSRRPCFACLPFPFLLRVNKCSRSQFCKKLSITAVSLSFFLLRPPFFFPPPSLFFYRRWDSCRRPFFSLGRKRGRPPFFLRLEYLPPQRRNCSGCADSRSLIFSEPAHAVRRRRMWWSIRSSSRFDGAVSYYARTHMMASCAGPPNVDFSDSNFNHVAHVSSRSCGEVEENVLEHARFSWRTPS